jgi:hypothetical protein
VAHTKRHDNNDKRERNADTTDTLINVHVLPCLAPSKSTASIPLFFQPPAEFILNQDDVDDSAVITRVNRVIQ